MLKITEGKIHRPLKVVIYGAEGIGKSTLASKFPGALFIDTEGGTAQMDVRRLQTPATWDDLVSLVSEVAASPGICQSLVLDTADWAEMMCVKAICAKHKVTGLESFGYGKGFTFLAEEFGQLLEAFDQVISAGINVVITAHAKMRKFEQPDEMGAYDRWEMKLSRQVAPLLKEWSDLLLFLNYKTFVVAAENKTNKGQGGKRVMYTTHHVCWDAKNRFGLPDEMEVDFKGLAHLFDNRAATPDPHEALTALMTASGVSEEQLQKVVSERTQYKDTPLSGYTADFINSWIIPHWDKIVSLINN